jgi:hypothetical protein
MHALALLVAVCARAEARPDPNGFSHIYLITPSDEAYLHSELSTIMRKEGLKIVTQPYSAYMESQLLLALDVDWSNPVTIHILITDIDGNEVFVGRGECAYAHADTVKQAGFKALKDSLRLFTAAYYEFDPDRVTPKKRTAVMAELREVLKMLRDTETNAPAAAPPQQGPIIRL